MKKKDGKLPPPKKVKLDEYDILQTLGTGIFKICITIHKRLFWARPSCSRSQVKGISRGQNIKEG